MNPLDLLARLESEGLSPSLKLRLDGDAEPSAETLELVRHHKADLLSTLIGVQGIPRLPWQLEALLKAAATGVLPKGTTRLEGGSVSDLGTHVMAWGCTYLAGGDPEESLKRLWRAYRAWQQEEVN